MPRLPVISRRFALPRHDLTVLDEHRRILSSLQRRFLDAVLYRIEKYEKRFNRDDDDYASTAGLILMSDWPHRHRFCHCCIRNKKCKVWKYCPHCAYVRANKNVERLLPLYPKGQWHFVTISFNGNIRFEIPYDERPLPYWDAIHKALREWVAEHHIEGVFWVEELYLRTLCPSVLVLPHCHALVHATEISEAAKEACIETVVKYKGETWDWRTNADEPDEYEVVELALNIKVDPILDEKQFIQNLRYMTKPIDLVGPYRRGIDRLTDDNGFIELNQSLDDFLAAHDLHCLKRQQLNYIGSLDVKRGRLYLGNQ